MLMNASLVWDGGDEVVIPKNMGAPREDQMLGTVGEQLSEVAGRICYDSLGRGRSSQDYHANLLEVGHGSVFEHYTRTFAITLANTCRPEHLHELLVIFLGRKGVWVEWKPDIIRVTMNIRSALEWHKWTGASLDDRCIILDRCVGEKLVSLWNSTLAPQIVGMFEPGGSQSSSIKSVSIVKPESDHEKWISLYMSGSRGFSHEQVRHGDETAISQRSTRYVQESKSPWVTHPLVAKFLKEGPEKDTKQVRDLTDTTTSTAQHTYDTTVRLVEVWLLSRLPEDMPYRVTTARKQARGAARGYLGNALFTEMVFSASVAQWRHMIRMRAADAADAEIRTVFNNAIPALQGSRYGDRFADIELEPASDGLGLSLTGGGAK